MIVNTTLVKISVKTNQSISYNFFYSNVLFGVEVTVILTLNANKININITDVYEKASEKCFNEKVGKSHKVGCFWSYSQQ